MLRVEQAEPVRQGGPFAEAGQVDAFRMDVVAASGFLDGPEDVILDLRVGAVLPPGEGGPAVGAPAERVRPAEADADVVAAAQARGQPQHLFVAAAVAVQEHHQWIGVIVLVPGGQERAQRPAGRRLHFGGVKALAGAEQ